MKLIKETLLVVGWLAVTHVALGQGFDSGSVSARPGPAPKLQLVAQGGTAHEQPADAPALNLLYDQATNTTTYGITSQDFVYYDAYDSEGADDFVVPAGRVWTVEQVQVLGFVSQTAYPVQQVQVSFYADTAGLPGGAPLWTRQIALASPSLGNVSVALPSPPAFGAGRYWLSVRAVLGVAGNAQWFWNERTVLGHRPSAWRNPPGGFGTPCANWGVRLAGCGVGYDPDLAFALFGTDAAAPPPTTASSLISFSFDNLAGRQVPNLVHPGWMNGTIVGNTSTTSGASGQALHFDGDGDYVDIVGSESLSFNQRLVVEADVRIAATQTTSDGQIVSAGNRWQLFYDRPYNFLQFQINLGSPVWVRYYFDAQDNIGAWNRVSASYSAATGEISIRFNNRTPATLAVSGSMSGEGQIRIGQGLATWTAFSGDIDNVRVAGDPPVCHAVSTAVEPAVVPAPVPQSRTGASTTFGCGAGTFVRGDIVTLTVPSRTQSHMFFEWRRPGDVLAWRDTQVDGAFFEIADHTGDGMLDDNERMLAGWWKLRHDSTIALVVLGPVEITAFYFGLDDAPTIERFPVNGAHNTGYYRGERYGPFYCDYRTELHSNSDCHDGGAIDIFGATGTPVVAGQSGVITFECDSLGGNVAYILETVAGGRKWKHYYAHLDKVCSSDATYPCGAPPTPDPAEECVDGLLTPGSSVVAGTRIGFLGKTGSANGTVPHVHYGIFRPSGGGPFPGCNTRESTYWINPYPFLRPNELASCSAGRPADVDVVLLIDTTNTMGNVLAAVQTSADSILARIKATLGSTARVAVADYRDEPQYPWGGNADYRFSVASDFSDDAATVVAGLRRLDIGAGGDRPDAVFSALIGAIRSEEGLGPWRAAAAKFIVLIGDAPPHRPQEPYSPYYSFADVIAAAQHPGNAGIARALRDAAGAGLTLESVAVGDDPETLSSFARLAAETGGGFRTSTGGADVVDVLTRVFEEIAAGANPDPNNSAPDTRHAVPTLARLWPPNHRLAEVAIDGVTDPDGDPVTLAITSVTQDEPVAGTGAGDQAPDASGLGGGLARLRAERAGGGDGRVYEVRFVATDGRGGRSSGSVQVCVPHDQSDAGCGDDGQLFDSIVP